MILTGSDSATVQGMTAIFISAAAMEGVTATGARGMCRGATAKVPRRCLQKSCVSTSRTTALTRFRPTIPSQGNLRRLSKRFFVTAFRNPFGVSFDPRNGDMLIGDVAGSITAKRWTCRATLNPGGGENYGWRIREGSIQSTCDQRPKPPDAVDPILDYAHDTTGSCVIGGYVYRGKKVRALHN